VGKKPVGFLRQGGMHLLEMEPDVVVYGFVGLGHEFMEQKRRFIQQMLVGFFEERGDLFNVMGSEYEFDVIHVLFHRVTHLLIPFGGLVVEKPGHGLQGGVRRCGKDLFHDANKQQIHGFKVQLVGGIECDDVGVVCGEHCVESRIEE